MPEFPTDDELDAQRSAGIVKALKVTELLAALRVTCTAVETDIAELKAVNNDELGGCKNTALRSATRSTEDTLHRLTGLMNRAASAADAAEFEKLRVVIDALLACVKKATQEATDCVTCLVRVNNDTAEATGLPPPQYSFRVDTPVEDRIVLVRDDGVAHVFEGDSWAPLDGADDVRCAHVISGNRLVTVPADSEVRYVSPDGDYSIDKEGMCRKSKGVRFQIAGPDSTCVLKTGDLLLAVFAEDRSIHVLDLEGSGGWKLLSDDLQFTSIAYLGDSLVATTTDGGVVQSCVDSLTPGSPFAWSPVPGTSDGDAYVSVGTRAPKGFALLDPEGRVMKQDRGIVRLEAGTDLSFKMICPNDLHGGKRGFSALSVAGSVDDLALMHFNYVAYVQKYAGMDFTFAWKLLPAGDGTWYVYNDFAADSWLGYDVQAEAVVIVCEDDPTRVRWTRIGE